MRGSFCLNTTSNIETDVTGSALNMQEPLKQLSDTFEILLSGLSPSKTKILRARDKSDVFDLTCV